MIAQRTLKNLEFDKILTLICEYSASDMAKSKVLALKPQVDFNALVLSLEKTEESIKYIDNYSVKPYFGFDDVGSLLISAKKGATLSPRELLSVATLLKTSQNVANSINLVEDEQLFRIKEQLSLLVNDINLLKKIDEWILNDTDIADSASEKLFYTRRKIRQTNESIKSKMQEYVVSNKYQKYLQDAIVTVRNSRYVIPVKVEFKGVIAGLIHDQSQSGATIFVEPFPIVELNNELTTLRATEKAEIERILSSLSRQIGDIADGLIENMDILSDIDVIFAKAQYSIVTNSTKPIVNEGGIIDIKQGRHPLIDKDKVVPVSVALGDKYSILLVTGSNTGGKTVTLKLVGLLTLMAMSGLYIPAKDESKIAVFNSIFTDIGDEQSIQQSLSTFSAHITNVSQILGQIDDKSLVLLDELGAGTDPTEGAAIAVSVTQELLDRRSKAIVTTHYSEMKAFSFKTDGIQNAHMEFDPVDFAPTYKLSIGMPGASNALVIAKRLGLDASVVARAQSYISQDKIRFEDVLIEAQSIKLQAEKDLAQISTDKKAIEEQLRLAENERNRLELERKKLNENAEKKAKKIIEDYVEEAEEILAQIKQAKDKRDDRSYFEATKLNKRLENLRYKGVEDVKQRQFDDTPISVGDKVLVDGLDGEAEVIEIKSNGKCRLKIGAMELNSTLKSLKKIKSTPKTEQKAKKVTVSKPLNTESVPTVLNVIGKNREECLVELEYFMDKAVMSGLTFVQIVHGVGTGILRKAVWEYLKGLSYVSSFRLGRYGEGESGVTIVELNK